ncbi:hypothetical protein MXB_194, partial [Myxobolus squamalis]
MGKDNDEYSKLKEISHELTVPLQSRINTLVNDRDRLLFEIQSVNTSLLVLEKRRESLIDNENDVTGRINKICGKSQNFETLLNDKTLNYDQISKEIAQAKQDRTETSKNLEKVTEFLSTYKLDLIENEKQKRYNIIGEKLKLFFPGVHGRLGDLIEPIHKRYSVAITKVLGRHIDAFVVDNHSVAFDCIEYLREQQLGRIVFIPLTGLKSKPMIEKYRQLGGTAKLLIDTVNYDKYLQPIVNFVFGSTIVCDEIDEAAKISIGLIERRK